MKSRIKDKGQRIKDKVKSKKAKGKSCTSLIYVDHFKVENL
jgi:hypothetical protein